MPAHHDNADETHALFPSGEWEGFYTYAYGPDADRHPMHFVLQFRDGVVSGGGGDDVGPFHWHGTYDKASLRCQMTKYYATHTVFYDGHVDENGIWGNWNIHSYFTGGFHIWPKNKEENGSEAEVEAAEERKEIKISG